MQSYGNKRLFSPAREPSRGHRLFGESPQVIGLDKGPAPLLLDFGRFSGPPELGPPSAHHAVKGFNPSIVPAPRDLCKGMARPDDCAFVAAVRADVMHQCGRFSPLYSLEATRQSPTGAWFKNTACARARSTRTLARHRVS